MGLVWHSIKSLIAAYKSGTCFDSSATIGRQNLYISPAELRALLDLDSSLSGRFAEYFDPYPEYAEPVYHLLGAKEIVSVDASGYEGATVVHDLNKPIGDELRERFDFVHDCGTLEHVFNFPQAIKNCMEMVKVGGTLMLDTPANNNFGHGFYQFSPDLLFRVLSPENGYQVERMVVFESFDFSQWYEVADPQAVRSRVELLNSRRRVQLIARARRIKIADILTTAPQQSDYVLEWERAEPVKMANPFLQEPPEFRIAVKRRLERWAPRLIRAVRSYKNFRANRHFTFKRQPHFFKPVDI
jgi:hypothetical protein